MRSIVSRILGTRFTVFGILAILALVVAQSAAVFADSTTKHINFDRDVMIGTAKIKAGDYTLVVDSGTLTVKSGKKVVATSPAHWETRSTNYERDSVLYGTDDHVIEIRFAHQPAVLVIAAP
jgi:hypothetical protein